MDTSVDETRLGVKDEFESEEEDSGMDDEEVSFYFLNSYLPSMFTVAIAYNWLGFLESCNVFPSGVFFSQSYKKLSPMDCWNLV